MEVVDNFQCPAGEVAHMGRCVRPRINRRVFLYDIPRNYKINQAELNIPEPEIDTNVILIRTPTELLAPKPIIVPPPQQNHVVYVLNKQLEQDQRVIQVTAPPPSNPEVFFVNYEEGENPVLPIGVDLETAVNAALPLAGDGIGQAVDNSFGFGGSVSDPVLPPGIPAGVPALKPPMSVGVNVQEIVNGGASYGLPASLYSTPVRRV